MKRLLLILAAVAVAALPAMAQGTVVGKVTSDPTGLTCASPPPYANYPILLWNTGSTVRQYYCNSGTLTYQVVGSGVGDMLISAYDPNSLGGAVSLRHATSCATYTPTVTGGRTYLCWQDSDQTLYTWDQTTSGWVVSSGGSGTDTTCATAGVDCALSSGDSVPWSILTNVPTGLSDGDDDTTIGDGLPLSVGVAIRVASAGTPVVWEPYTPENCQGTACNLHASTTVDSKAVCLADGTGCPEGVADTYCGNGAGDFACTLDDDTIDMSGSTITGGTPLRCARWDASGNLVPASGDCAAGDTGGATAQALDADSDATLNVAVSGTTLQFDPDDDGTVEATVTANGAYTGYGATLGNDAAQVGYLRLAELTGNGTNYINFQAPASIAANRSCTFTDATRMIPQSCVGNTSDWSVSSTAPGYYFDQTDGTDQDARIYVNGSTMIFQRYQTDGTLYSGYTFATMNVQAPSNSFYLNSTGDIGFGTASPVYDLEVRRTDGAIGRFYSTGASTSAALVLAGTRTTDGNVAYLDFTNGTTSNVRLYANRSGADGTATLFFQTAVTGTLSDRMVLSSTALALSTGTGLSLGGGLDMNSHNLTEGAAATFAGTVTAGSVAVPQHATDGQYLQLYEGADDGSQFFELKVPDSGLDLSTNSGGTFSSGVCTLRADGRIPDACVGDGSDAGGAGSGDIDTVGNCTAGDCFADGTDNGSALVYEGATVDTNQTTLTFTGDPGGDYTVTIPNETGTMCTTAAVCTGYASSGANSSITSLSGLSTPLSGAQGGTGNGFFAVSGPASSLKTFTFPNASATVLTDNAAVTVAQGGTGAATLTDHGVLVGSGTSAVTPLSVGTNGQVLVGSTGADPVFATVNAARSLTATTGAGTLQVDADVELYTDEESWVIYSGVATAGDDLLVRASGNLTVVGLYCTATGATTPTETVTVIECTSAGASCASIGLTASMTATTTLVSDTDFTGGDSGIADGNFWGLDMTTLTTEADILHCTVEFTRND